MTAILSLGQALADGPLCQAGTTAWNADDWDIAADAANRIMVAVEGDAADETEGS